MCGFTGLLTTILGGIPHVMVVVMTRASTSHNQPFRFCHTDFNLLTRFCLGIDFDTENMVLLGRSSPSIVSGGSLKLDSLKSGDGLSRTN